jgi:hypothetical protein
VCVWYVCVAPDKKILLTLMNETESVISVGKARNFAIVVVTWA